MRRIPYALKRHGAAETRTISGAGQRHLLAVVSAAMEPITDHARSLKRLFDDGGPFAISSPGPEGRPSTGIVVTSMMCDNPDCPCRRMTLVVHRLEIGADGVGCPSKAPVGYVDLDVDTAEIVAHEGPDGNKRYPELVDEVRSLMSDPHVEFLQERWHRLKRAAVADWRMQDWSAIETELLVPYLQVFPDDWDLGADCDGSRFWILDNWCLKPGCRCDEFAAEVLREDGTSVGMIRVAVDSWKVLGGKAAPMAKRVWREFIRNADARKTVKARRRAMREVAKALPQCVAVQQPTESKLPAPRVGRNDPCPCGSGKKHKKCCGG